MDDLWHANEQQLEEEIKEGCRIAGIPYPPRPAQPTRWQRLQRKLGRTDWWFVAEITFQWVVLIGAFYCIFKFVATAQPVLKQYGLEEPAKYLVIALGCLTTLKSMGKRD